jgi:hypothetical protein
MTGRVGEEGDGLLAHVKWKTGRKLIIELLSEHE